MSKLLKFLKPYIGVIVLIMAALGMQAYCDLSLPTYTSDIVNVGIQQHGITENIPHEITKEDMGILLNFVPEKSKAFVMDAYKESAKGTLVIKKSYTEEKQSKKLSDILKTPMFIGMILKDDSLVKGSDFGGGKVDLSDPKMLEAAVNSGMLQKEIDKKMEGVPDTILDQATFSYVEQAYKNANVNIESRQNKYILNMGAKMLLLAAIGMTASILVGYMASRIGAGVGRDLRRKVFTKVVGFSNAEFDKFSTASLITRSTNDVQQVQMMLVVLLRLVLYSPIMAIGGIWKVFQTNVSMVWIIGVGVAALLVVVITLFVLVMPKFKIVQNLLDKINLVSREILTGLEVVRAFGTQKYEEERFDKANKNFTKVNLFVNRAMTFMMPIMMFIMNCLTVLILWNGAHDINTGDMQVGDMMAFIQYAMQIIMSFLMLTFVSVMLPRAAVAAGRIDEVLVSETAIKDPKTAKHFDKEKKGVVRFHNVSFGYPGAEEDVLKNISFTAKNGQTTAIIGSTGSGKSTLINLIPRFYDPTKGTVTIDGVDIKEVKQHDLREMIGYVPQKGILFSGDIKSNIMYSDPQGKEATMIEAARVAQAEDFISKKEEGYNSPIAQGGGNVSGGQKQRLSIARAVAKNPNIYIFDDSFSALDFKTDLTLRKALKEHTDDATVIIVAQRIGTIVNAEQIIVLDEGEIAGIGTHKELLKTCDEYLQIASSQLSEEELKRDLEEAR